jgi:hypothetical protein
MEIIGFFVTVTELSCSDDCIDEFPLSTLSDCPASPQAQPKAQKSENAVNKSTFLAFI